MRLDELDLKLINLLIEDARLNISELARLLGVSRQTVRARMERLEREGVILGYTVKLSPAVGNATTILMVVETDNLEKLTEYSEVVEVYRVSSRRFVVKVVISKIRELSSLTSDPSINVLEIMPVLEVWERERIVTLEVPFKCDYCGKEMVDEPIVYKHHNKVYVLCCRTCLREFRELTK